MPVQLDRTTLSRGPAMVSFNGAVFFSAGDITIDWGIATSPIPSDAFGPLDYFRTGLLPTIKFKLVGEFESLPVLWPYGSTPIGASIVGATDTPLLIQPVDSTQQQITFQSAVISRMPNITASVKGTLLGDIEFKCLRKNNYSVTAVDSLFTRATNTISTLPYDPTKVIIQPYIGSYMNGGTVTWTYGANSTSALVYNVTAAALSTALNALASITSAGGVSVTGDYVNGYIITFTTTGTRTNFTATFAVDGSGFSVPTGSTLKQTILTLGASGVAQIVSVIVAPWSGFTTEAGFNITFDVKTTDITSEAVGLADVLLDEITVTCTFIPQGMTAAQWEAVSALQGTSSFLGTKASTIGNDLVLVGVNGGAYFRLYKAGVTKLTEIRSRSKDEVGEVELRATRSVAAGGSLNPLFAISSAAIP